MPARLIFLAGKGGVGKTACAAALALALGELLPAGRRVLVASVDPAHSLADALAVPLGGAVRTVPGTRGRVAAVEIAADRAARRWLTARRPALDALAESAGALDREDVERLLALPLPGVDEFAALLGLARWATAGFDCIVIDTAPSGHFLELVRTPALLADLVRGFDRARVDAREVRAHLSGRREHDAADRFIAELDALARGLSELLRDRRRTTVRWVLIPERLSLDETLDGLAALGAAGIAIEDLLVNRWPTAALRGSGASERREIVATLHRRAPGVPVRLLPELAREPRGRPALRALGRLLLAPLDTAKPPLATRPARAAAGRATPAERVRRPTGPPFADLLGPGVRLVLVTGKGGVGKTTTAAALALQSAAAATVGGAPARREVRLVSVDPAHSLADVLGVALGNRWRRIAAGGGLAATVLARELSADAVWRGWRRRLDGVLARDPAAREAWSDLLGTPDGFAEIAAAFDLAATLDAQPRALLVVDCPPTGHALRLLAAPALAVAWIHAGLSTLLKYRQVAPLGPFSDWLLQLAQSLTRLRDLLRNPDACVALVVTRPGAVVEAETRRLLRRLRVAATPAAAMISIAPQRARPLPASPSGEARRAARGRTRDGGCAIIAAPVLDPPPHGAAELRRWAGTWIELPSSP